MFSKTESNFSKEMELLIKDIKNTTQKKYMDYGKNPGSPDNDFLFMYSVARYEQIHCKCYTTGPNTWSKMYSCLILEVFAGIIWL